MIKGRVASAVGEEEEEVVGGGAKLAVALQRLSEATV